MRHVRSWVGVGAVLMFAGSAAAQPGAFPGGGGPGTFGTAAPGGAAPMMPAPMMPTPTAPPAAPPAAGGTGAAAAPMRSLADLHEEHSPLKDLTPHGGFGDIKPHEKHHEEQEIPGSLAAMVPHHGGWYTSGEYLLMRPRNSDFDFVLRSTGTGLGTVGPIESLKYTLGSGLRVGLGYVFDGGKWETNFTYTYFTAGADTIIGGSANAPLLPTVTRPGLTDRALRATATADLDYQLYDMSAGRRFVIEDNLAVRAMAGFRFTDIRQTFDAFFDGLDARGASYRTRSRFQGFGPTVGAEGTLACSNGLHLYARGQFGFLSGRNTNQVVELNDSGATTYVNVRNDKQREVPFGTAAVGLGWQYRTIALRGGYEVTHFQGIFERPRFVDDVGQGKVINRSSNLSLEGLFLQVSVIY